MKLRRTPNSLNWIDTADPFCEPCTTGIGNSPPARKLASLPLSATRFGSARLWKMPRCCIARITVPRSYFSLSRNRLRKSLTENLPSADVTALPNSLEALVHARSVKPGAENCCVVTRPSVLLMPVGLVKSDMPNSVRAERLTSAKRTFSSTWLLAGPSRTCSSVTTSSRFST